MYVLRQIAAHLAQGRLDEISEAVVFPWRLKDVLPKYALNVGEALISQGETVANSTTYSIPLPSAYVNTERLACYIKATGADPVKVTVVSPDHGTSEFMLSPTNSDLLGVHDGLIVWCGTVTSINVINAGAATTIPVEWFLFQLPDLDAASGYRLGQLALGVAG